MPENDPYVFGKPYTPQHAPSYPRTTQAVAVAVLPGLKSPAAAVVLSLFFPGVGSMYAGKGGKGTAILVGYIVSVCLSFLLIGIPFAIWLWIWGMVAGANDAQKYNDLIIRHARVAGQSWN